jgi:hypothetical protein
MYAHDPYPPKDERSIADRQTGLGLSKYTQAIVVAPCYKRQEYPLITTRLSVVIECYMREKILAFPNLCYNIAAFAGI